MCPSSFGVQYSTRVPLRGWSLGRGYVYTWAARADVPTRTNHPSRCRLGHVRLETRLPLELKYTGEGGAWGRGYPELAPVRSSPQLPLQHKMAKNSRMALCCQNRVSKGTNQSYGLHNISVYGASVMVLGLTGKEEEEEETLSTKRHFCHFQASYLNRSNSNYKWLRYSRTAK